MALRFDITRCVALVFGAMLLTARAVTASAGDAVPLRIQYSAPHACPSAEAFMAEVVARTPLARPAGDGEPGTALSVTVKDVPGGSTGRLELVAPDATSSVREVSAADCEQVVAALALMTALAVDPNAATGPIQPVLPPTPPPLERKPAAKVESLPARFVFEAGAQLEALGGIGPDPVALIRPFVQVSREGSSAWSYALRLSAGRAHTRISNQEGSGAFTLWTARVEACPLRFWLVRPLALSACVPFDAGQLTAAGSGVTPSRDVARPWLSLGGEGRVEWRVFDMFMLEAAAELVFPIVRDRFFVGSSSTLHRAPAVTVGASVGIGVRFP
jgi:hypothetical protein